MEFASEAEKLMTVLPAPIEQHFRNRQKIVSSANLGKYALSGHYSRIVSKNSKIGTQNREKVII